MTIDQITKEIFGILAEGTGLEHDTNIFGKVRDLVASAQFAETDFPSIRILVDDDLIERLGFDPSSLDRDDYIDLTETMFTRVWEVVDDKAFDWAKNLELPERAEENVFSVELTPYCMLCGHPDAVHKNGEGCLHVGANGWQDCPCGYGPGEYAREKEAK